MNLSAKLEENYLEWLTNLPNGMDGNIPGQ
jgi:hypothetical protein